MGRAQQKVIAASVLEPEQRIAVLCPPASDFVILTGQQGGERHLLGPDGLHLLMHDTGHIVVHQLPERQ